MLTTIGAFSILKKPSDRDAGTLTVRARVRADPEALARHLPETGGIADGVGTDYPFGMLAPRAAVARALAGLAEGIGDRDFKDAVGARRGPARAAVFGAV
ncbi:MAG: hypothetical protein NZM40_09695 [Sphingomonadaceae bacterium]|uniref:hypothetical protein n=1 Tax=Thermaurantiacus sp. TaxID=2820283 RepID=UPI00298F05DC|nr:hypothetical protein [Thermaurantiacus sp.]MCS6987680.1 hypothetical protein [Sphingomonadaceae bacterium]MDW8415281.1 hypothetical protein [Thermaurantiacus sp.]